MNILQDLNNPWNVPTLSDFMFYNCPECVYKCKDDTDFQTHAVVNHPQAKCFFEKLEENHELILENNHMNFSTDDQHNNSVENELKIKTEDDEENNDTKILDSKFFDNFNIIHEDDGDESDFKPDQSDFDWFPESTSDLEQKYENQNSNQTSIRSKNRNLPGSKSKNKKLISRKKVVCDDGIIDNDSAELASNKKDYLCEYCLMKFPKLSDVKEHIQGD